MTNIVERGMNFVLSDSDIRVELDSHDNGLKLVAIITDINKNSKVAAFGMIDKYCNFKTSKQFMVSLSSCDYEIEKIDIFAYDDDAHSINATLFITQDNHVQHCIQINHTNVKACMIGRIYNHNGIWKAKNLTEGLIGDINAISKVYNGHKFSESLLKMKSQDTSNRSSQIGSELRQNAEQINRERFNSSQSSPTIYGKTETMNLGSDLPAVGRPTFGRNCSNSGFSSKVEQGQKAATETIDNILSQGRSLFSRFTGFSMGVAKEAADEVNKLRSKKLLEGVIASCAYMSFADGYVDEAEKVKTIEVMSNHQYLKLFERNDIIACFDSYIRCFEKDFDEGEIYVFESLSPLKGLYDESSLILAVALDIANADGIFSPDEERALKRIRLILDA